MTSWRIASSGSCDLTLKYSGEGNRNKWVGRERTGYLERKESTRQLLLIWRRTHSSGLHAHAVLSTQKHESVRVFLPVRSLARSGWFMRQWLANLTHSNLIGTWMSLNLFLIKETDVNVGDFKRWLVHEHSSKKTASHVGTQHTSTSSLYITLCHMTPAQPSHIFWTRSKIQVYWGRISLTLSQIN